MAVVRWVVRGALVALVAVSASPAGAVAATGQAPVIVVLDASGSMDDQLAGGDIKIDAARDAVHALVDQLPDGAQLGLAVYGNGARGCQDATVVHKVKPLDRSAVNAAVDEVRAAGDTPIGRALRVAAAELPAAGPRSIVLVSDGEDTCAPPDPCDVAKELAKQGIDLRIHAIGFDVDDTAKEQLTCLSQATGGTYVEARDAGTLSRTLNQITRDAAGSGGFWSNLTEKPLFWIGVSLLALLLAALVIVLIVRGRRATKPASGTPAWSRPGPPY